MEGERLLSLISFFLFFLISKMRACMHQGIVPLQSIPTGLQARPQGTDLADNSLGCVDCTTHHPGSRGVARHCDSHNAPVETLQLLISTRAGPAEDYSPL